MSSFGGDFNAPSCHGKGMLSVSKIRGKDKDNTHVWVSYRLKDVLHHAIKCKRRQHDCLHTHVIFCDNPFYEFFKPHCNSTHHLACFTKSRILVAASMIVKYDFH